MIAQNDSNSPKLAISVSLVLYLMQYLVQLNDIIMFMTVQFFFKVKQAQLYCNSFDH